MLLHDDVIILAFVSTAELKIQISEFTGLPQLQLVEVSNCNSLRGRLHETSCVCATCICIYVHIATYVRTICTCVLCRCNKCMNLCTMWTKFHIRMYVYMYTYSYLHTY